MITKGNVLIIGGTGFIGQAIQREFKGNDYNVYVIARGKAPGVVQDKNHFFKCDRKNYNDLKIILKDIHFDYLIDLCAYEDEDVVKTLDCINLSCLKKYIVFSTGAVADYDTLPIADDSAFSKDSAKYIQGKIRVEKAVINSGINYLILRPSCIYGVNDNIGRIQIILDAIRNGKKIYMRNQRNIINLLYVDDLARITKLFMESKIVNDSYFVYNPQHNKHIEIIEKIEHLLGRKAIYAEKKFYADVIFPFLPINIVIHSEKFEHFVKEFSFTLLDDGLEMTDAVEFHKADERSSSIDTD